MNRRRSPTPLPVVENHSSASNQLFAHIYSPSPPRRSSAGVAALFTSSPRPQPSSLPGSTRYGMAQRARVSSAHHRGNGTHRCSALSAAVIGCTLHSDGQLGADANSIPEPRIARSYRSATPVTRPLGSWSRRPRARVDSPGLCKMSTTYWWVAPNERILHAR